MSEMSDLSEVVDDGVLSESYQIKRLTGSFELGGWQTQSTIINGWGVVSVARQQDLLMIPEGDRVTGIMVFHSKLRIYETQIDGPPVVSASNPNQRVSDIMLWNSNQWRVIAVFPYPNRNFWKAFAVRIEGV